MSSEQRPLADRTLLVSGGSRGIGLAIALGAARQGANVVLLAKTAEPHPKLPGTVHTAGADVEAVGAKAVAVVGDVRKEEDVARAVDTAVQAFGGIDIVVNNAANPLAQPLGAQTPDAWQKSFDVNLRGPVFLVQTALPHLRAARGAIVNVTSDAAIEGYEGWGGYGASKAALEQLSRVLAAEEPDVRVLWVDPGDMRTQTLKEVWNGDDLRGFRRNLRSKRVYAGCHGCCNLRYVGGKKFGLAGVIELVGGVLIAAGIFTSPLAFIASGEMAFAYFQAHAPRGWWPIQNGGELAVLYSFLFLYFAARGNGALSVQGK